MSELKISPRSPNSFSVEVFQWKLIGDKEGYAKIATFEVHAVDNRLHISRREENFEKFKVLVDRYSDYSAVMNNTCLEFKTNTLDILIEPPPAKEIEPLFAAEKKLVCAECGQPPDLCTCGEEGKERERRGRRKK